MSRRMDRIPVMVWIYGGNDNDNDDDDDGLDIRRLLLLGDHQSGPLPPRGAGHQSAGHGGLHPVQVGSHNLATS